MKHLLYLGYYDTDANRAENRNVPLAARNKMDYICSALNRAGWNVEIVSPCVTADAAGYPGKRVILSEHTELQLFPTMGTGGFLKRALRRALMQLRLFFWLFRRVQPGTQLLAYHSLSYMRLLKLLKRLKRFRLILEVEEIYADVCGDRKLKARELKLFRMADAYLFPSELLEETVNAAHKPAAVVYGTYQTEAPRDPLLFDDGAVHLVYAGTLDPRKGGAKTAAAAAEKVPAGFYTHVIGFGADDEIDTLQKQMEEIRGRSAAAVSYDGVFRGAEYTRFLQSCHIGLSTQSADGAFNETSFPSKVLSYLANGLRVVSVRLKALERSAIGDLLYFYDEDTPEAVAAAVRRIDFSEPYDSRAVIRRLDEAFVQAIGRILEYE